MVAWRTAFLVCLVFSLATLVQRGYGDLDDFNLEDALKETSSVKQRWDHFSTTTRRPGTTRAPANPAGSNFGLTDALSDGNDGRQKPSTGGRERWDHVTTTTTRRPGTTRAPSNPVEPDDLNLADALDDQNVIDGRKKPNVGEGGGLSDKDLEDILGGGGYKPDKNKGGNLGLCLNSGQSSCPSLPGSLTVCWDYRYVFLYLAYAILLKPVSIQ
ncbi:CD99 antigen-like protein 2 isoform X4 [Peromyscus eremicus]|uniref:CD99 antigen-like protein 2 isoform X4 n=1 Tax=Peromyscus eremicus TaxID=42410 RepID=UPI0027DE1502|nr:CD99 antigen-like protein 2 isoform X4 [Peromyscus eremicus]